MLLLKRAFGRKEAEIGRDGPRVVEGKGEAGVGSTMRGSELSLVFIGSVL